MTAISEISTIRGWLKYLTNDNYFTPKEIAYRKSMIEDSGIDYSTVYDEVMQYRMKKKSHLITLNEQEFTFVKTHKMLHYTDKIKDFWKAHANIIKENYKGELLFDSLLSEAFSSSSIEGAHSTKKRTAEIIKQSLKPMDKSERMIVNNFHAMEFIFENRGAPLNNDFILSLHKMITENTLDETKDEGVFRDGDVDILSATQKVIFSPISNIAKMNKMIEHLYRYVNTINSDFEDEYIEPLYKAISFHFLYGFIHPHFDGNGRTLRVLFTHLLGSYGYDMFYYISLS